MLTSRLSVPKFERYRPVRASGCAAACGQPLYRLTFLAEIGWREFCYQLIDLFDEMPNTPFKDQFAAFPWDNCEAQLKAWQQGQTGYPIVDAGMRELWQTGFMHNRVRMIVASFLTKHLLVHWLEGERWFWDCLLDADIASNACSWQWVAGSGADAAPYFRIFTPLRRDRFDPRAITSVAGVLNSRSYLRNLSTHRKAPR